MRRILIAMAALSGVALWCTALGADRVETGKMHGKRFVDARYGFTFEKHQDWKLAVPKENPGKPSPCRAEFRREGVRTLKRVIISGFQRRGAKRPEPLSLSNTPTITGGLYVDTTSLDINEFKDVLVGERGGRNQHLVHGVLADFLRHSICIRQELASLGGVGPGFELGFRAVVATDPVSSLTYGTVYFTVKNGKVYLFYFSSSETDFLEDCRSEIDRMINSLTAPDDKPRRPPIADLHWADN